MIKDISPSGQVFTLGFPNREVKSSLLDGLLSIYRDREDEDTMAEIDDLRTALTGGDVSGMVQQLNAIIASIPYDHWRADTESIFTIITYLIFKKVGIDVYSELHSSKGRCDVLIKTKNYIYALELKLDGTATEALEQIKEKGYLQPYAGDPRKKIAVGISFSSETRGVEEHLVEEL